jgi:hypothetical protein
VYVICRTVLNGDQPTAIWPADVWRIMSNDPFTARLSRMLSALSLTGSKVSPSASGRTVRVNSKSTLATASPASLTSTGFTRLNPGAPVDTAKVPSGMAAMA